jgi:hypothetical protein
MIVIGNDKGGATKMTTTVVVAITRDAVTVVSMRGMVASRGSNTSSARRRTWPREDEEGEEYL